MRLVLTVLFAGLFAVAFTVFFLTHSLLTYVTTPAGIADIARSADTRELALDAVEDLIREQLKGDYPLIQEGVVRQTREAIEETVTSEWFYDTLEATYPGFVEFLEHDDDTSEIELGEIRDQLRRDLGDIADGLQRDCQALLDAEACADDSDIAAFVEDYRVAIDRAIAEIPEKTTISELLRDAGLDFMVTDSEELRDLRRVLGAARTARWIALVLTILLLAAIAALNMSSLGRTLIAVGASLLVAGTLYLAVVAVLRGPVGDGVSERMDAGRAELSTGVTETVEALAIRVCQHALSDQNGVVIFLMVLGAASCLGGVLLGRRR